MGLGHQEEFAGGESLAGAGKMLVEVSQVSALTVLPVPAEGVG